MSPCASMSSWKMFVVGTSRNVVAPLEVFPEDSKGRIPLGLGHSDLVLDFPDVPGHVLGHPGPVAEQDQEKFVGGVTIVQKLHGIFSSLEDFRFHGSADIEHQAQGYRRWFLGKIQDFLLTFC